MADQDVVTEAAVVREFLGALERFDIDGAVEMLDPEIVYQNVPFPPARGLSAVERQLRGLARWGSGFEVRYDNIATDGPVVLTERTDTISLGPVDAAFWVCGTFEIHDGLITLWRDRFDFADLTWAFIRGAARALLGRMVRRPAT